MILFRFFAQDSPREVKRVAFYFLLAGIASLTVLAGINAELQYPGRFRLSLIVEILVSAVLFSVFFRICVKKLTAVCEDALARVRMRLSEAIRRARLSDLEQIGEARLYEQIVHNTTLISHACWPLAAGVLGAFIFVLMLGYIAYLSSAALLLLLVMMGISAFQYRRRKKYAQAKLKQAGAARLALYDGLTDLLEGLPQVQLHRQRGDELVDDFARMAKSLREVTVETTGLDQADYVFVHIALLAVLSLTVFLLPKYVSLHPWTVTELAVAIVFLLGPISSFMNTLPDMERANLAAQNILALERQLAQNKRAIPAAKRSPGNGRFSELRLAELRYQHVDETGRLGFTLGPISFSITAGEIVFIVGGNGSGKTTLLKLLTTLYSPTAGRLLVDGVAIGEHNAEAYRELIVAIFSDFHLFPKLYGLPGISSAQVDELLRTMHLSQCTGLQKGRFTNLALSSGQRKRLAMVVALLEDRPLYIFDEWAADQDPEFRRYFYEELLPDLKRRGKTVIAISHDDRYFHCADRVITLDYGAIRSGPASP